MKHADKNRDPDRARKRATTDLRCAARKLAAYLTVNGRGEEAELLTSCVEDTARTVDEIENASGGGEA